MYVYIYIWYIPVYFYIHMLCQFAQAFLLLKQPLLVHNATEQAKRHPSLCPGDVRPLLLLFQLQLQQDVQASDEATSILWNLNHFPIIQLQRSRDGHAQVFHLD